jgi:nicotinate-nucleotide pyrophosphorylase (carboxylating)
MSIIPHNKSVQEFIHAALLEDVGEGDHTSLACINSEQEGNAYVKVKEAGLLAGVSIANEIFKYSDNKLQIDLVRLDGEEVAPGDIIIKIKGKIQSILKTERLVLNCMQRMSGIATKTRMLTGLLKGTKTKLLDTRKTTPNFRYYEKLAVKIGGGVNHRFGLYDMILIKDNHVDSSGGIVPAIKKANDYLKRNNMQLQIEIETRNIDEVQQVINYGNIHRIMLDNFSIQMLEKAVQLIDGKFETEASGSINENNIRDVANTGVDFISVGALTHSYKSLDINLKIDKYN